MTGTYQHPYSTSQYGQLLDTSHDGLRQVAAHYTVANGIKIGEVTRATQKWGTNHVEATITAENLEDLGLEPTGADPVDEHNMIWVCGDELGHTHLWANHHGNPMQYIRTVNAASGVAGGFDTGPTIPDCGTSITYPATCRFSDGHVVFTCRDVGGPRGGDRGIWHLEPGETEWGARGTLLQGSSLAGGGTGPSPPGADTTSNYGPYFNTPYVEAPWEPHPDRAHVAVVWRQLSTAAEDVFTNIRLSYAYSDDKFTTCKTIAGAAVTLPLDPVSDSGIIVGIGPLGVSDPDAYDWINNPSICVDHLGYPHIVIQYLNLFGIGDAHHVFWDGDSWNYESFTYDVVGDTILRCGRSNVFWHRGRLRLLAAAEEDGGARYPYVFIPSLDQGCRIGGRTDPDRGWEQGYDPGAWQHYRTIETATPEYDQFRVHTYGARARVR